MSKCVKLETKKYKSRDSPPYSAMDCKGAKLLGNDGQQYISKADKNGIYKWVKIAGKSESTLKIYSYFDGLTNIQHIYKVYPSENKVAEEIFKKDAYIGNQKISKKDYEKIISNNKIIKTKIHNYDSIYFSKNLGAEWHTNAIVIGKGANYINLMDKKKYKISEPIKTILFEVDGNWIPYSAIITKNHIYLSDYPGIEIVKDKEFDLKNFVFKTQAIKNSKSFLSVLQPVEDFDLKKDAYMQYYGWHIKSEHQKNYHKKYIDRRIEYPVKVLFKRFY